MKVLVFTLAFAVTGASFAATATNKASNANLVKTESNEARPTQLDDLIRGEMAAVRSYNTVLEKVKDPQEKERLTSMKKDHEKAVAELKKHANKDVKEDTTEAGVWGSFASAYAGGAKLFGNKTAMRALKQGEEHGVREYEEALEDGSINADLKNKIRAEFLPKQKEHIKTIERYVQ